MFVINSKFCVECDKYNQLNLFCFDEVFQREVIRGIYEMDFIH